MGQARNRGSYRERLAGAMVRQHEEDLRREREQEERLAQRTPAERKREVVDAMNTATVLGLATGLLAPVRRISEEEQLRLIRAQMGLSFGPR